MAVVVHLTDVRVPAENRLPKANSLGVDGFHVGHVPDDVVLEQNPVSAQAPTMPNSSSTLPSVGAARR